MLIINYKSVSKFKLLQNPSWSYTYRDIIPMILAEGHDIIALDLIGYGMSDRVVDEHEISAELHAHTIGTLINQVIFIQFNYQLFSKI